MYYVMIDLEWNQYHNPMWTPTSREGVIMHEEIIQIGAVKTDETLTPVDTFNVFVRLGKRRRLDRYVKKLTGITENDLMCGEDFPVAAEMFSAWLQGVDAVFSWGADDRRVFLNNLSFYGLEAPACAWYDAQKIYAAQYPDHGPLALKNIAEERKVRVNLSLHNAMNDAILTGFVMRDLDLNKGMKEYSAVKPRPESELPTPVATAKTHRHATQQEAWDEACASLLHCPACMAALTWTGEEQGSIERWYKTAACATHGEYIIRGEFLGQKSCTMKLSFYESNDETRKMVETELNPVKKTRRRRKRGGKKNTDPVAVVASDDLLGKAITFASDAHKDQQLLPGTAPYIVHPMEVTSICAAMSDDPALLSACMLHDTLTMCPQVTGELIRSSFGDHVAELIEGNAARGIDLSGKLNGPAYEDMSEEEMMLLISDLTSALRGMLRSYEKQGADFWKDLGSDTKKQMAAYFKAVTEKLDPLKETPVYTEFTGIIGKLFGRRRAK